jgi:hypothetical protein
MGTWAYTPPKKKKGLWRKIHYQITCKNSAHGSLSVGGGVNGYLHAVVIIHITASQESVSGLR